MIANWETPRGKAPRFQPVEPTTEEALQSTACEGIIEQSVRRKVAGRLQSTFSERTHSEPLTTPTRSIPRRSVVVKAPLIVHPSKGTIASIGTSIDAHYVESSRAGVLWPSSPQSPTAHNDVARATVPWRISTYAIGRASLGEGLRLAEGLKGEGPHVQADEEEEVDNRPGMCFTSEGRD